MMSCCIIAAQLVMLVIAMFAGRSADRWGRKPVLLAGFGILPIRAVLYTLSDDSAWLIAVQLLDGIGAGIFGVLTPLVVADLMHGTGRYNLALGVVATVQGVGASLSGLAAGLIVDNFGYGPAFLTAGGVAALALVVLLLAMPETSRSTLPQRHGEPERAAPARRALHPDGSAHLLDQTLADRQAEARAAVRAAGRRRLGEWFEQA
jgi:MFS family permease